MCKSCVNSWLNATFTLSCCWFKCTHHPCMLKKFFLCMRFNGSITVGCALLSATPVHAESDLIKNPPFLPQNWGEQTETMPKSIEVAPPPTVNQLPHEIEFRGVFQVGNGQPKFNIFDKKTQRGFWLTLNEPNERFRVTQYHKASGTVTLLTGGRSETMVIAKPDGTPLPIQSTHNSTMTGQPPRLPTKTGHALYQEDVSSNNACRIRNCKRIRFHRHLPALHQRYCQPLDI